MDGSVRISREDVVEDLVVQAIDLVVAGGDFAGAGLIDVDEGHDNVADLACGKLRHRGQLVVGDHARVARELAGLLGHRAGVVAHALQFVGDAVQGQEEAQVACDRSLRCDRHCHQGRDRTLDLVDLPVRGDHLLGQGCVAVHEGVVSGQDLLLNQRAHAQDAVLDAEHLGVEALAHADHLLIRPGDRIRSVCVDRLRLGRRHHRHHRAFVR